MLTKKPIIMIIKLKIEKTDSLIESLNYCWLTEAMHEYK